jgi:tRNA pseudouridine38-40 synthase
MISASGDGFLYKMVRSIAGWLIRVGQGDVPSARTLEILTSLDRTAAVPTALPQGLFLWKVWYPESSPTQ